MTNDKTHDRAISASASGPSALVAAAALLLAAPAAAAPGGVDPTPKGTMLISAERLFGLSGHRTTTAVPGGDYSTSHTGFSLLLSNPTSVYTLPRVAFDIALIDRLTVGGAIGVFVSGRDTAATEGGATTTAEGPSTTAFLLAPRVGYALGLTPLVSLWGRAGLTYFRTNREAEHEAGRTLTITSDRITGLSINLEPTVLFTPFANLAFSAALIADLPLAGTATHETTTDMAGTTRTTKTETDQKLRNVGVVVGMIGIF